MQILINSNNSVEVSHKMRDWAAGEVERILVHFADRITRVEVHLNDVNSDKGGTADKYCSIEARIKGMKPMAANYEASGFDLALAGAAARIEKILERSIGKQDQKKGRTPMGGEPFSDLSDPASSPASANERPEIS